MYLHLLILCGIWYQGIIGTFADEEIKESSDFLIRQKRVVSHLPGEDIKVPVANISYVVAVKYNMRMECTGAILSHHVVITASSCALMSPQNYQISSTTSRSDRGHNHDVIGIRRHLAIALLTIDPPFEFSAYCHSIDLHVSPLLPGMVGTVSGWGYDWRSANRGTNYPLNLRSIQVPIMAHRDCVNIYRPHSIAISDQEVCTYHPQRHSGHSDFGAPLVIDDYLAGIHLFTGPNAGQHTPEFPDTFAVLQHSAYSQWIRSNVENIDIQFLNGHH